MLSIITFVNLLLPNICIDPRPSPSKIFIWTPTELLVLAHLQCVISGTTLVQIQQTSTQMTGQVFSYLKQGILNTYSTGTFFRFNNYIFHCKFNLQLKIL
jgi:hypothetical protein